MKRSSVPALIFLSAVFSVPSSVAVLVFLVGLRAPPEASAAVASPSLSGRRRSVAKTAPPSPPRGIVARTSTTTRRRRPSSVLDVRGGGGGDGTDAVPSEDGGGEDGSASSSSSTPSSSEEASAATTDADAAAGPERRTDDEEEGRSPFFVKAAAKVKDLHSAASDSFRRGVETTGRRVESLREHMQSLAKNGRGSKNFLESTAEGVRTIASHPFWSGVVVKALSDPERGKPLTYLSSGLLTLVGSSLGFELFLYFVSVGYGMAIGLPALATMIAYNASSEVPIPTLTNVHALLVVLWSVRLCHFLLRREYVDWPELHDKTVEVDRRSKLGAKFFFWVTLSPFYFAMVSPVLFRFRSAAAASSGGDRPRGGASWGATGKLGIGLQIAGLTLESIADRQKSEFKSRPGRRADWCRSGLWRYSTNPNYLGEGTFWIGTYLGGAGACGTSVRRWITSTVGLTFILLVLRGAVSTLGAKQLRKYGMDEEFLEFRRTHDIFGPNGWRKRRGKRRRDTDEDDVAKVSF